VKRFALFPALFLAISLVACGGGGGGPSAASPYTGITAAATITPANADNIVLGAFQGGDAGASLAGPLGSSAGGTQGAPAAGRPAALSLAQALKEAAGKAWSRNSASGTAAPMAVVTESGTIDDGFGGSFTYTLSVDDQTGAFNGSFVFDDYHGDSGGAISGSVTVTGSFNFGTSSIDSLHFSFASLAMTDGFSSVTVSGSIDLLNGNPATATETLYLTDASTGKTVWIDNFTVNVTEGSGYTDVALSGKIYLHDYGYVVISTSTPFRYLAGSTYPSIGTMIVTGSSNGRARLTVIDSASFNVDVDADGDGTYEISTSHTWI
jgi:hypothetical protein